MCLLGFAEGKLNNSAGDCKIGSKLFGTPVSYFCEHSFSINIDFNIVQHCRFGMI